MKFLKLKPKLIILFGFHYFWYVVEKIGHKQEKLEVCALWHHILFWSEMGWDSWHGCRAARAPNRLSRKDRLGWWGIHGVVGIFVVWLPWRFLKFFLLGEWGVSWEVWVRPCSRSAWVMLVGACRRLSQWSGEWGAMDIVYLEFLRVVAASLVTSSSTKWWKYRLDRWTVRLKIGWVIRFKELWSAALSPSGTNH